MAGMRAQKMKRCFKKALNATKSLDIPKIWLWNQNH